MGRWFLSAEISHWRTTHLKKILLSTTAGLVASASLTVAITASASSPRAATTYSSSHISFSYPKSWKQLPKNLQTSFAKTLSKSAGSSAKVTALAGVYSQPKKKQAVIAVLAQMGFNKSFQKKLKGNHQLFINRFDQGVAKEASKVLSKSNHAKFAGQNNANELQILLASGGRYAFFVAIAPNDKTVDLAVMVVEPTSIWGKYNSTLSSIASSSRFK